ncbi:cobalamin biosynthesis protein CobT [Neorhizobium sp. P12A]|uniref:cobaltochelatase CobT-related protein n=1 Tax=Neorhizobium sp. P12A TaxID=2268027 RepID=UPI0011EBFA97|nr:cobalamin biosynthesis protein CobT [Neorhizobium sp. P12A]KAA0701246.1 cobalamin biosynthesis protein CobT [Neorhizobium sp. P12A]
MIQVFRGIKSLFTAQQPLKTPRQDENVPKSYHVFTREFDVTVHAYELDSILGRLPANQKTDHAQAWDEFSSALQHWRTKAHIASLEASSEIRATLKSEELHGVVVTILIDQSGSMRGQKMLMAAAACDIAQDFLTQLGIRTEVLGFTSVGWKGGQSRQLWERRGEPKAPGRLADTLHIIYKSAQNHRAGTMGDLLKPMLRPDLPKENIDGEAIEWAVSRQMEITAQRRILIVLSDGVPADDSTLLANDKGFLVRHLKEVIARIERERIVELIGIGIGFDTSAFYKNFAAISDPNDLGSVLIETIEHAIRK